MLYRYNITRRGLLYSDVETGPDPDSIQGLLELLRHKNGNELVHYIHAMSYWLLYALPEAELEMSSRGLLDSVEGVKGARLEVNRR